MWTCVWIFCSLLVMISMDRSEPQSPVSGVMGSQKHLAKGYFCSSDSECRSRLYCHAPGHALSQCLPCRRRARRCHGDRMCCPGNRCHNRVCTRVGRRVMAEHTAANRNKIPQSSRGTTPSSTHTNPNKGELGAKCVRSEDCGRGLCCARHLWKRVCKAEPREGQVCYAPWRKKHTHTRTAELFQLCPCSPDLSCRAQSDTHSHTPAHTGRDTHTHTHSHSHTLQSRLHTCQQH